MTRQIVLTYVLAMPALADPTPHTHQGLFLRGRAGAGWIGVQAKDPYGPPGTSNLSTGVGKLELDLGGAVSPHLALFGLSYLELSGDALVSRASGGGGGRLGAGFGGSYFFNNDFHLTAALSTALFVLDLPNREDATYGLQPVIHFGGGKDWWFSDQGTFGLWAELSAGFFADTPRGAVPTLSALVGIAVTHN